MTARYYPAPNSRENWHSIPWADRFPGLGDAYSDCANNLNKLPTDYVFRGSVLQYNADVWESGAAVERSQIEGAVQSAGFDYVSATTNRGLVSSGRYNISITFTSRIDRNSVNDVQGNVYNAVLSVGLVIASDTIAIVSRPPVTSLCGQSVLPGVPTAPPSGDSPGTAPPSQTPQWLRDLEVALGIGSGTLLIGGAVIAFLLLRK